MNAPTEFAARVTADLAIAAAALGLLALPLFGEGQAASYAAGALWVALSFRLLAWLLEALAAGRGRSRLFIFTLACAKIPASYFLLFWLYNVDYLEPIGLTAGLTTLPVVLLFRGLAQARQERGIISASEEGS